MKRFRERNYFIRGEINTLNSFKKMLIEQIENKDNEEIRVLKYALYGVMDTVKNYVLHETPYYDYLKNNNKWFGAINIYDITPEKVDDFINILYFVYEVK